jgi:hypothetical protein
MKVQSKMLVGVILTAILSSCVTEPPRVAGELPKKWWTMDVDPIENIYRESADGIESKVKLFIGLSDEPTNISKSDAIEDATMKVSVELSRYLATAVTNINQSAKFNDYIKQVVKDDNVKGGEYESVVNEVKKQVNNFSATLTTTQFSGMKIIGKHAEKVKKEDYYQAWVVVSMTDRILDQTLKLQEEAFKNMLELNPEYKQIIADINTEITKSIKNNIAEKTDM